MSLPGELHLLYVAYKPFPSVLLSLKEDVRPSI